jgi:predicted DNA-binding protein
MQKLINIRMDPAAIAAAKAKAKAEGRTLSAVVREMIERWLEVANG